MRIRALSFRTGILLLGIAALAPTPAFGQSVFSDLGTNNNTFSSNPWCVSGANNSNCGPLVTRYIVASFFAPSTITLSSIEVAVGYNSGTNGVVISLTNNANGIPGTVLESWSVSNLSASFPPPLTTVVSRLNPMLEAGQTYWVELQGIAADTTHTVLSGSPPGIPPLRCLPEMPASAPGSGARCSSC